MGIETRDPSDQLNVLLYARPGSQLRVKFSVMADVYHKAGFDFSNHLR